MGCGCTRTFKDQKEIIEDLKRERMKNEEEIKLLQIEKEKVEVPGLEIRDTEEITKEIDKYINFIQSLKDLELELEKYEYSNLGQLQDLLEVLYTFPQSNCFEEVPRQVHKIREFFLTNLNVKLIKNQKDLIDEVEGFLNVFIEETKKEKIDLTKQENAWFSIFIKQYNTLISCLKKNEYENLSRLQEYIISYNRTKESKNIFTITEYYKKVSLFLEKYKKNIAR